MACNVRRRFTAYSKASQRLPRLYRAALRPSIEIEMRPVHSVTYGAAYLRIRPVAIASLGLGMLLAGCSNGIEQTSAPSGTSALIAITITNAAIPDLTVGATVTLAALATDEYGKTIANVSLTWTSSNAAIASVSNGIVTANGIGDAVISAAASGRSASANVKVVPPVATTPTPPPPTPTPPAPPLTGTETKATLPQVYVDTRLPAAPAPGGRIISVAAGGNLQAALNTALPGDVIEIENGATFNGNFTLPNKNSTSTNWITIRPANMSGMPAEGSRMTPGIAAAVRLPLLLSVNNQGAIATAAGAHHYRLIGIEVSVPATILNTGLVRFDGLQTTVAQVPHHLVVDRSYVHGTASGAVRRCITLNSAHSAVIDSYVSDCHDTGSDAQAIASWSSPGPLKIVNNYLEGSGENIMFGGGDPGVTNMVASDIEIRRNHVFKPTSWNGKWLVKNLFELKSAARVLVEGNVFDGSWQDGQGGNAFNIKSTNQDGACTACGTSDVTIRFNMIRNVGSGFILSGAPDTYPTTVHLQRVTVTDNVMSNMNTGAFLGDGRGLLINGDPADIVFAHNTVMSATNAAVMYGGPTGAVIRGSIRDNVMGGGGYGVKGSGVASGTASITAFMPGGAFLGNVIVLPSSAGYPMGNFYPTTAALVGFQNAGTFDFRLSATSVYRLKGTDGRDPGADVTALNSAISGVIVP